MTEWYFPVRLALDTSVPANPQVAQADGWAVYHPNGRSQVKVIVVNGDPGLGTERTSSPGYQVVVSKGFTHLDPMFEAVYSPSQLDDVFNPIINFMRANAH